ncbi:DUF5994 family protein [Amycolatopsis cihanbeyliensis]|uniref:Uncharacterized protein n=1 Tax=Amycolatopsis cihanbeyliensis TaxID=1128664 RepID=A0A542DGW0_AMYCI|nr:DUF5994 family protein [Amycolatopsis cihanbeyliensis]TQJ02271.1 hypothetical protein FB471_1993 [Amycolatopsis cihanbeyliensis]
MTSGPHTPVATPVATAPPRIIGPLRPALRLRLKPKAPTTGHVDGAWWPRSRNLAAELPQLFAVLEIRPGRIERLTYNLAAWKPAARRLPVEGHAVRLDGFRSQHPDTVTVVGKDRQRLTLLVIPPDATSALARQASTRAARQGDVTSVEELLAPRVGVAEAVETATQRWEMDGGRV